MMRVPDSDKPLLRKLARNAIKAIRQKRGYKSYQKRLSRKDWNDAKALVKAAYLRIKRAQRKRLRGY